MLKRSFSILLSSLPHSTAFFWLDTSEGPAASGAWPFLWGLCYFHRLGEYHFTISRWAGKYVEQRRCNHYISALRRQVVHVNTSEQAKI